MPSAAEPTRRYHLHVVMDRQQVLEAYQGHWQRLRVRSLEGPVVELAFNMIRPWVRHQGINQWFRLETDAGGKLRNLTPVTLRKRRS